VNYLITGGKGFIGSHLANKLAKVKKNKIFIIDDLSNPCQNPLNNKIKIFYGDISDFIFLKKIIIKNKIEIIFHLAATINSSIKSEISSLDVKNTIISTINILEILKLYPKKKIIFGSTIGVYGKSFGKIFNEKSCLYPEFSYSISKRSAEDYVNYYTKYYKIKSAIIRIGNVYGPYQSKIGEVGVINIFIKNLIKNKILSIYGDGNQKRNFIFINDVVEFLEKSVKLVGTYNLVSNYSNSINDLIKILSNNSYKIKIRTIKQKIEEIGDFKISNKKAIETGWKIKYSIKNGITKTYNFYEKHRKFL
jgi:nucleoside-diphosphate-sugar epimerase